MNSLPVMLVAITLSACASAAAPPSSPSQAGRATALPGNALPVREVTVFKDGHAFVLREGRVTLGAGGTLVLNELPAPVLGTFWPYARGETKLVSATAAREKVSVRRTALALAELLEANAGADVELVDVSGEHTSGKLLGIPLRSAAELEGTDGPPKDATGPRLPQKGTLVLVRTAAGTRAFPLERVRDVSIAGELQGQLTSEELRSRLTLSFGGTAPAGGAEVGLVYVQKGLRWIPSYKVDIDGKGHARIDMGATLQNDLIDLDDATVNLVIGVPSFEFKDLVDPIALQDLAAQLGQRVQPDQSFSNFLSNSIQSQTAVYRGAGESAGPAAPEVAGAAANEDLFVFTLKHVTLRRGERMALPVVDLAVGYRDAYTLDVPFAPPVELRQQFQGERAEQLARLSAAPKVLHVLRLKNDAAVPLTTAPALLLSAGRVLSQALMTYTPVGSEVDLALGTALDVGVLPDELEAKRTANAVRWGGDDYHRIDMSGTIELTNRKKEAVEVEVRRTVLGLVDQADNGGTSVQLGLAEFGYGSERPAWWGWWSWPYWWWHWNGIGRFTWKAALAPGQKLVLGSSWHYFWR